MQLFLSLVYVGLGSMFGGLSRYGLTLATQNRVNLRFDVAYGRDGAEYYISLGEAF